MDEEQVNAIYKRKEAERVRASRARRKAEKEAMLKNPTPIIDEKKEDPKPQKKTDFPVEAITMMKESTGKMMKDPVTGEEDPILKIMDRVEKLIERYGPLVGAFMQGIKARNDEMQAQRQQVQQVQFQSRGVQAPPGWEGMSPIDKMKRKYDGEGNLSAWYQAGLQYDQYMATGQVVQIPQPQYHRPQSRQEQPPRQEMTHEPQTLQALSNKYPEPPLEIETPSQPIQAQNPHHAVESVRQDRLDQEKISAEQKAKFEENMKYLAIAINYLNNMSEQEFRDLLNDLDGSFKKISSPFVKMMIPNDVKVMIKQIDANQLTSLLQESCPEKYKIIEETKSMSPLSTRFIAWRDAL